MISRFFIALFLLSFNVGLIAQTVFVEENSRVIVELESIVTNGWQKGDTVLSGRNIQYIYGLNSYLSTPGNFKMVCKIKITNTGTYRFAWHSKVGKGASGTEHNDTWLRIADATAFFATKNGVVLRPKGVCTTDCPEGSGRDGWFKVYSHGTPATGWKWHTATNDKDAFPVYARFASPGIYTIEISMRSDYQFLDRFVMFNEAVSPLSQSTSLALPESKTEVVNSVSQPKEQINIFRLNSATKELNADVQTDWTLFHINGVEQSKGFGNKINVSTLDAGIYILRTSYGAQKVIL